MSPATTPPRPAYGEEWLANRLFFLMSPGLTRSPQPEPPDGLGPWEPVTIETGALREAWLLP